MNGFLLDSNIPSELIRLRPEVRVSSWFNAQPEDSLFLSAVTIGELRRGFVLLPASSRRSVLEEWFENDLLPKFDNRILPVTKTIANRWGILDGEAQKRGSPLNTADGMIAATAFHHDLTLATRNVRDFANLGIQLYNPWDLLS